MCIIFEDRCIQFNQLRYLAFPYFRLLPINYVFTVLVYAIYAQQPLLFPKIELPLILILAFCCSARDQDTSNYPVAFLYAFMTRILFSQLVSAIVCLGRRICISAFIFWIPNQKDIVINFEAKTIDSTQHSFHPRCTYEGEDDLISSEANPQNYQFVGFRLTVSVPRNTLKTLGPQRLRILNRQ